MLARLSELTSRGVSELIKLSRPAPAPATHPPRKSGSDAATGLPSTRISTISSAGNAIVSARVMALTVSEWNAFATSA